MEVITNEEVLEWVTKLESFEGGKLHRNKSETDITTGLGIYRGAYPNEPVFTYIDGVAKKLNILTPSSKWTNNEVKKVDEYISSHPEDNQEILKLSSTFYLNYVSGFPFGLLHKESRYPVFNIYVNSKKIAVKAVQMTCNYFINLYYSDLSPLVEDGLYGKNTSTVLDRVYKDTKNKYDGEFGRVFAILFLAFCKSCYIDISTDGGKEDKHLQYLKGWDNRVNRLLKEIKLGE